MVFLIRDSLAWGMTAATHENNTQLANQPSPKLCLNFLHITWQRRTNDEMV